MKIFTGNELRDLLITILILSAIFAYPKLDVFFVSLIIVFFSYVLRQIAHKYVARKFGCMATFKIWFPGVIIGLMSMFFKDLFFGIVFVAVGFVDIMPYSFGRWGFKVARLGKKELGLISLAGISVNILLAIIFKMFPGDVFKTISLYNGLLALFSLIPYPPIDGSKLFLWEMWIWLFFLFITILTLFVF